MHTVNQLFEDFGSQHKEWSAWSHQRIVPGSRAIRKPFRARSPLIGSAVPSKCQTVQTSSNAVSGPQTTRPVTRLIRSYGPARVEIGNSKCVQSPPRDSSLQNLDHLELRVVCSQKRRPETQSQVASTSQCYGLGQFPTQAFLRTTLECRAGGKHRVRAWPRSGRQRAPVSR